MSEPETMDVTGVPAVDGAHPVQSVSADFWKERGNTGIEILTKVPYRAYEATIGLTFSSFARTPCIPAFVRSAALFSLFVTITPD